MTYDDAYIDHVAGIYLASSGLRLAMSFGTFIALHEVLSGPFVGGAIAPNFQKFLPLLPAQLAVQAAVDSGQGVRP